MQKSNKLKNKQKKKKKKLKTKRNAERALRERLYICRQQ